MSFGAMRTDEDRLIKSISQNKVLDSQPTEPEHVNWKMRPRTRKLEIGPEFKFNSHLQVERVIDHLQKNPGH